MKVLTTIKLNQEEKESIKQLGYEIITEQEEGLEYRDDLKDVEILFCYAPFETLDISRMKNLKWIQLGSVGINHVPLDKVQQQRIILTNNKGGFSIPIAEWIVLTILEMVKNSREFYEKQDQSLWKRDNNLLEIYGKTVGFIGTGSIAGETAKRLEAFGVDIIGFNSSGHDVDYFHKTYSVDKIIDKIHECDFVIVTVPYTDETHHMINEQVFSNMKDGVCLVNIARGSIIDEEALIKSLKNGKIKKAALDVFEVEPLPTESPLWAMRNVKISPHNSGVSEMNHNVRFKAFYENLKRYANGEKLKNIVDIDKGY